MGDDILRRALRLNRATAELERLAEARLALATQRRDRVRSEEQSLLAAPPADGRLEGLVSHRRLDRLKVLGHEGAAADAAVARAQAGLARSRLAHEVAARRLSAARTAEERRAEEAAIEAFLSARWFLRGP